MSAEKILNCLKQRHNTDLFIPECRVGPTMYAPKGEKPVRMDAYVIKKNWNYDYIGYEIKVSRGDFKRSQMRNQISQYTAYCNRFYVVCPWGLLKSEEVDPAIGLIYCSKNFTRTIIQKESEFWMPNPGKLYELMHYVLTQRVAVK